MIFRSLSYSHLKMMARVHKFHRHQRLLNTRAGKQVQRHGAHEERAAIYNPLNVNHLLPVENTVSALHNPHGAKINERERGREDFPLSHRL